MYNLYENISALCKERGITPGGLCGELGFRRSVLSDLKNGRKKTLDTTTLVKIADYFSVSLDSLLNGSDTEKAPTPEGGRESRKEELMAAFWGGEKDLSPEDLEAMWADVESFAAFVAEKKRREKQK